MSLTRIYNPLGMFIVNATGVAIFAAPFLIYFAAVYIGFKPPRWLKAISALVGLLWTTLFLTVSCGCLYRANPHESTKVQLQIIANTMCKYKGECGSFPESLESLVSLANVEKTEKHSLTNCEFAARGYLKVFKYSDGWKRPFIYDFNQRRPAIMSLGSDGVIGGEDHAEDLIQEVVCNEMRTE